MEFELAECPVCLETYSSDSNIPRVLSCGHSTCELCLTQRLIKKHQHILRCPACTQLVKFPIYGVSSLPKNIDLLELIPQKPPKLPQNPVVCSQQFDSVSRLWSDEFYSTWENWVLPEDGVFVESEEEGYGVLKDSNCKVMIFKLFNSGDTLLPSNGTSESVFKFNYVARVMNFLYSMEEGLITELSSIFKVCSKCSKICKLYGFWLDLKGGILYLAFEKLNATVLDHFENGIGKEFLSSFSMMGMEMCESMIALHLERLFLGCLSLPCFELDDFGHVNITFGKILLAGSSVHEAVMDAGYDGRGIISDNEMGILVSDVFKKEIFISPELLFQMIKKEGFEVDSDRSDVWSLACVLLRVLIGKEFINELVDYVVGFISNLAAEENCSDLYTGLVEKVRSSFGSKLGEEYEPLQQILCRCLNFDSKNRPLVIDVWKCIRGLIFGFQFDAFLKLDDSVHEKNKGHCLVLGESPLTFTRMSKMNTKHGLQRALYGSGENVIQSDKIGVNKDFAEGFFNGKVKVKDMEGHLDSVTGLAIGGGFLFSSSFDKSVNVWSLEDFSHLHTFKGHQHKVTAVVYVEEGEPLCVSGDDGGGIFMWSITMPLRQEPLKRWCQITPWRCSSGIHALTTAGNGYLYTGNGDSSIKGWPFKYDGRKCSMSGHKSVVSTLVASDGVLYSGSWDGTIRLWSLTSHSLLTVLGEDMPGPMTSVVSLTVHQNMLLAGNENGQIKIWRNEEFIKSIQQHDGAVYAIGMEGRRLFTGGWDTCVRVQVHVIM